MCNIIAVNILSILEKHISEKMKIFRPSQIIGTATLGLASVIGTTSALSEDKKEGPKVLQPIPEAKKDNVVKPQVKINLDKEALNKKLVEEIYNFLDKDLIKEPEEREKAAALFNMLPEIEKVKIAKRVLTNTKTAFINKAPDLKKQELHTVHLILILESCLPMNRTILKDILLKTQNEYQDLIGVYIKALSKDTNKKDDERNAVLLRFIVTDYVPKYAPPKMFDEKWNPQIKKIIDRVDVELKVGSKEREISIDALSQLAMLELRDNSSVKEPKIYFDLIRVLNKNFEKNWLDIVPALFDIVKTEPFYNDNPQGERVFRGVGGFPEHAKLNDALIKPFEEIIKRSLTQFPKDSREHNRALEIAISLCSRPYNRDNPDFIIAWQEPILANIVKAKPKEIPELLKNFRKDCDNWNPNPSHEGHRKVFKAGAKHLKLIIEIGCKHLLDKDEGKNVLGSLIVRGVRKAYYDHGPHDFSKDKEVKDLFLKVLDRMQKEKLDVTALRMQLSNTIDFLHLSWNDADIVREGASAINAQVKQTCDAKKNGLDKEWVEYLEIGLLDTTSEFTGWMWSTFGRRQKEEEIAKNIEPLYRDIGEKILKDNSNPKVLDKGHELIRLLHRFMNNEKEPDIASKRFIQTAIDPIFKNFIDSASKLPQKEKDDLLNRIQNDDFSWVFSWVREPDLPATTKLLEIFSKSYFDSTLDKDLDRFSTSVTKHIDPKISWGWHPIAILETLRLNKDYLNVVTKESIKNIDSDKDSIELERQMIYLQFLKHSQDLLSDKRTSFYPKEKAKDLDVFIKDSSNSLSKIFISKLKTEKVIIKKSSHFNHTIYDKHFELPIQRLKALIAIHPEQREACLEIIDKRLVGEKDGRTRGMLYKAISNVSSTNETLKSFKKALVKEPFSLASQKIGEVITEMFLNELLEGNSKELIFSGNINAGIRRDEIKKLKLNWKVGAFNMRLLDVFTKGTVEPNEKTPVQDFLLTCVLYSKGRNIENLLKENLDADLVKKLNPEPGKEVNPEIIKIAHRILRNSNDILTAFGVALNEETKCLICEDKELMEFIPEVKILHEAGLKAKQTTSHITWLLEKNLRWGSIENLPDITNALVSLYNKQDDYDKNMQGLSERIFIGTDKKLSMFENYEDVLQHRFVWKYLEDYRKTKGKDDSVEESCKTFLRSIEKIEKINDRKLRTDAQKDLTLELRRLDEKLFNDMVSNPLYNARLNFFREFIELAPSQQKREYINIALSKFDLRSHITEQDLLKTLEIE